MYKAKIELLTVDSVNGSFFYDTKGHKKRSLISSTHIIRRSPFGSPSLLGSPLGFLLRSKLGVLFIFSMKKLRLHSN